MRGGPTKDEGRETRICQTEHTGARFGKYEGGVGGPVKGDGRDTRICETEHLCAQFGKCEGGGDGPAKNDSSAKPSTCVLDLANTRVEWVGL